MLNKTIHDHIDKQDELEDGISSEIDELYEQLQGSIDALVDNPQDVLFAFVDLVKDMFENEYAPQALKNGVDIGAKFEELKSKIKIQDTDDPQVNKGDALNDNSPN